MYACLHIKELSEQAKLREIADAFSPLVENSAPGMIVFEVAGLEALIGNDIQIASAIATTAGKAGVRANVALASNPNAAACAAVNIEGVTVIPEGSEMEFLGDIPIKAFCSSCSDLMLGLDSSPMGFDSSQDAVRRRIEIVDTLRGWGIHSFRDFAHLPEPNVFERLGQEGVLLHRFARGQLPRPLVVDTPPAPFMESIELDDAIDNLEPLSFVVSGLTDRLCTALAGRALATQELRLCLKLDDKQELAYAIRLPFPSQDGRSLSKLLILEVQLNPPVSPVVFIHVSAVPVIPRVTHRQLFEQAAPEPEKLELTLARLARLVGANNIGSPAPLDTHRPDAFGLKRLTVIREARRARRKKTSTPEKPQPALLPRLALRRFRPPLHATVEQRDGLPVSINAIGHGTNKSVRGRVIRLSGPWRTSGDWWGPDPWSRDEWDAALSDGAVYRIYYDFRSTAWFVEGVYD